MTQMVTASENAKTQETVPFVLLLIMVQMHLVQEFVKNVLINAQVVHLIQHVLSVIMVGILMKTMSYVKMSATKHASLVVLQEVIRVLYVLRIIT